MHEEKFELVIGLEVHIQLNTLSKAFCADGTQFGVSPNTQVSAVSLGLPGTLPRANQAQLRSAVKLGLALEAHISPVSYFDRKNYFYADLPKGYQITQDRQPILQGGRLPIKLNEQWRNVGIHHVHMEEDAGKSIHQPDLPHSQIDLNRAGVPLLEVVTEPDLRSADEVDAFMTATRRLVRYLDISDGNMEQGSLRCDINISIRPHGAEWLGQRCEVKNINSMRYARQAIAFEFARQAELVTAGERVAQQTLNFDPQTGVTSPLRSKEDAHDYRYFPEPDLPPVIVTEDLLRELNSELPELPQQVYRKLVERDQLSDYDASILMEELQAYQVYEELLAAGATPKPAANVLINKILPYCQERQLPVSGYPVGPAAIVGLLELVQAGKLSNSVAYQQVLPALQLSPQSDALELARQLDVIQESDESTLRTVIEEVIAQHGGKVMAYRKGKKGLIGFFMGQIMRASGGKADPQLTKQLLSEYLDPQ